MTTTLVREDLLADLSLFSVRGDLDAAGAVAIQDEIESYATQHPARFIVDLANVDFLASYGLRVLLSVGKILREGGGELHLAAPTERVNVVLTTSGYHNLFPVHETVEAARSHFGI